MATAELIDNGIAQSVIRFNVTDAKIAELADEYLPLIIDGIDDKEGFEVVHKARMEVKNLRVSVDKRRKELKADALAYGRRVDGEAKRITALLAPIEEHLSNEEQRVNDEKERIARADEEKRQAMIRQRLEQLRDVGVVAMQSEVAHLSDDEYAAKLNAATAQHEEKLKADAEEAERRKAEQERLDRERAELEKQRAEQEAEQARIREEREKIERQQRAEQERLDAERRKLEEAERERQRQIELEKAREEAAERARLEEAARIEREAEERLEREAAEKGEAERLEALRPDREKLLAVADAVDAIVVPDVSAAARDTAQKIIESLEYAAVQIREIAAEMN